MPHIRKAIRKQAQLCLCTVNCNILLKMIKQKPYGYLQCVKTCKKNDLQRIQGARFRCYVHKNKTLIISNKKIDYLQNRLTTNLFAISGEQKTTGADLASVELW